ncbi:MFS transporter, partial [Pseudomonas sp.]|uniref:MFS transporter n=1 Tax=Pseudomonas sp. TaxID=306 RepID=UPI002613B9E0
MSDTITAHIEQLPAQAVPGVESCPPPVPFWRASFVVMIGIVASTLAQDKLLARIPLRNLLKNDLHLDRTGMAIFLFAAGFAWYLKPLFGAVIDAFPMFGSRRRSYMIVGSVLAALGWAVTGVGSNAYVSLLVAMMLTSCAMVLVSCATGGLLVETAQASGTAGKLAGIRQVANSACFIVGAPVSGYLAGVAFGWTALACALIAASLVPVAILFLREPHLPPQPLSALGDQLRAIGRARPVWAAGAIILMFFIAPGTESALFYRQQNDLHMTTGAQGWIVFAAYATGIVTALCYTRLCRRFTLRSLLLIGIGANACTQSLYLFYNSIPAAFAIEAINGAGFALAELAFMDMSARATPRGSESLGYALMISVRTFALFGTDIIGANLLDHHGWHFDGLVLVNTATSLLALPLVFLLP